MTDKFMLMRAEKANHTIGLMARLLGVSRAGYHAWVKRAGRPGPRQARREDLAGRVKTSHVQSRGTYGYRRVAADLAADGVPASHGLVRKLMRAQGPG